MTMVLIAAIAILAVALVIALVMLMRGGNGAQQQMQFDELGERLEASALAQTREYERLERELRGEISETARVSRTELNGGFSQFQQTLASQFTSMTTVQAGKIDGFAQQLVKLTETNAQHLDAVRETLQQQAHQARDEQSITL